MTTATRTCSYCSEPSKATTVSASPGNPTAPRAALDHEACYSQLLREIVAPGPAMAEAER